MSLLLCWKNTELKHVFMVIFTVRVFQMQLKERCRLEGQGRSARIGFSPPERRNGGCALGRPFGF